MTTRKHFEKTAAILAGERALAQNSGNEGARLAVASITFSLADMFAQDNPRFDRAAFYRAAGMDA